MSLLITLFQIIYRLYIQYTQSLSTYNHPPVSCLIRVSLHLTMAVMIRLPPPEDTEVFTGRPPATTSDLISDDDRSIAADSWSIKSDYGSTLDDDQRHADASEALSAVIYPPISDYRLYTHLSLSLCMHIYLFIFLCQWVYFICNRRITRDRCLYLCMTEFRGFIWTSLRNRLKNVDECAAIGTMTCVWELVVSVLDFRIRNFK